VILEIFYFYKLACHDIGGKWLWQREWQQQWHRLAHVCQQWRTIIFASQKRLDLRLLCTPKTSIKQTSDIWPAFPIIVQHIYAQHDGWSNTIATLRQRDRICEINLDFVNLHNTVFKMMQKPFPLLESLSLSGRGVPCGGSFLGGSAPHLRLLHLEAFQYEGFELPQILSSATHLVDLHLEQVKRTDYIPPEVLVAALSTMVQLKSLYLQFLYASSHSSNPGNISPPLSGYTHCSTLLCLYFDGPCNYLEDLLSRISARSLESMDVRLFDPTESDFSEFSQFLCRIESQRLPDIVEVEYYDHGIYLVHIQSLPLPRDQPKRSEWLRLEFPHTSYHGVSPITQICQQISPILSGVRTLSVPLLKDTGYSEDRHGHWLDLLRVFDGVEEVHLTGSYFECPRFPSALKLVMASDVLPALRKLSLDKKGYWYDSESRDHVASLIDAGNLARFHPITLQWLNQ
jgi:hypothetical protein